MSVILWNKKYGETLAQTLERFRYEYSEYKDEKVTYAGRLDPLASGLLLLLTGKDLFKKEEYIGLSKKYRMSFVLGIETDTGDILGNIESFCEEYKEHNPVDFSLFEGKQIQSYPKFSSKTVNGKPLWLWSREGRIDDIVIPTKEIEIFSIYKVNQKKLSKKDFRKKVISAINLVQGDFRQNGILKKWDSYFRETKRDNFVIFEIEAFVSSGTYMRTLAQKIGETFSCGGTSLEIKRISIGNFSL